MRARSRALAVMAAALVIYGCAASTSGQTGGDPPAPRATPQSSYSPQVAATVALLQSALDAQGIAVLTPTVSYQPGESAGVGSAPRVLLQADVHDPAAGWILVYEFTDAGTAAARGGEFADYLESGFGQTNYPLDAQFALSQVGGTLVFTWWSPERVADRDVSRTAFETVASVGAPIPVLK